jgi:DNA-binding transcriptional regulator YdaS (Cro superfamily)
VQDIIDRACAAAGGLARLAVSIGQSPQTVANWRSRGVPVVHCLAIERATDGAVTRRHLRPNDWELIWPDLSADASPAVPDAAEARDAAGPGADIDAAHTA